MANAFLPEDAQKLLKGKMKMANAFLPEEAQKLLKGKKILFLGDSILRNIYQNMLWLLEHGTHTPADSLENKAIQMETFCGDKLVPGTGELAPGTNYWEVREFRGGSKLGGMTATYVFFTRCFSKKLEDFITKSREDPPDIVLMMPALWDVNSGGDHAARAHEYRENLPKLLKLITKTYPQSTQVILLTHPPIAVMGNVKTRIPKEFGVDVVDLHYWMMDQIDQRMPDGIHWTPDAIRMQLNIILTHLCLSRGITLPGRFKTYEKASLDSGLFNWNPRSSTESKGNPKSSTEAKGNHISSTESIVDDYTGICWSCSKTKLEVKLYKCAGCKRAKYCSGECIEHDWPVHKNWCLKQQKKRENLAINNIE